MRKRILLLLLLCLTACSHQRSKAEHNLTYLKSWEDDFHDVLKDDKALYIEYEYDLIKQMLMRYEVGYDTTYFYGFQVTDLDDLCDILTHIVPFDVRLTLETTIYQKQEQDRELYKIVIENLDYEYDRALLKAKAILEEILQDGMSVYEKSKAIHDYLITHTVYDFQQQIQKDTDSRAYSASGALLEGKAVCSGYARAYMMLAELAGIPCLYVAAEAIDHAWNMIYDGTKWLYVDVAWDDKDDDRLYDTYLNLNYDAFFLDGKHVLDRLEPESFYRKIGNEFFRR